MVEQVLCFRGRWVLCRVSGLPVVSDVGTLLDLENFNCKMRIKSGLQSKDS